MTTMMHTPWGAPQDIEELAEGVWRVSTASHGGLKLSRERWNALPGLRPGRHVHRDLRRGGLRGSPSSGRCWDWATTASGRLALQDWRATSSATPPRCPYLRRKPAGRWPLPRRRLDRGSLPGTDHQVQHRVRHPHTSGRVLRRATTAMPCEAHGRLGKGCSRAARTLTALAGRLISPHRAEGGRPVDREINDQCRGIQEMQPFFSTTCPMAGAWRCSASATASPTC